MLYYTEIKERVVEDRFVFSGINKDLNLFVIFSTPEKVYNPEKKAYQTNSNIKAISLNMIDTEKFHHLFGYGKKKFSFRSPKDWKKVIKKEAFLSPEGMERWISRECIPVAGTIPPYLQRFIAEGKKKAAEEAQIIVDSAIKEKKKRSYKKK